MKKRMVLNKKGLLLISALSIPLPLLAALDSNNMTVFIISKLIAFIDAIIVIYLTRYLPSKYTD